MAKNVRVMRPGIILPFDCVPILEKVGDKARSAFFMACLYYGRDLIEPEFEGQGFTEMEQARLEVLWEQTKPRLDKDADGWRDGVIQRYYASYCKKAKKDGETPVPYADYKLYYDRMEATDTPIFPP